MKKFKTFLFYFLSYTWGIIMTLIGSVAMLALLIAGHKVEKFNGRYFIRVGKSWGGVELGCFFLTDSSPTLHIKQHESGHGIQNIILGPLMPFVVCIPSAIRYWIMEMKDYRSKWSFVLALMSICIAVSVVLLSIGIVCNVLACTIIGGILGGYTILLLIWLLPFELPKYKNGDPDYDSIHFEGGATRIGEALFPDETEKGSITFKDLIKNL